MVLGRMVYFLLPGKKLYGFRATRIALVFVWLDIISFMVQLTGGLMLAGSNIPLDQLKLGTHIYMAGIGLQQFFIVIFFAGAIGLYLELIKLENTGEFLGTVKETWRPTMVTIYVSLLLITVSLSHSLKSF